MYTKQRQGWSKHLEFIIFDSILLILAYRLAFALHFQSFTYSPGTVLRNASVVIIYSVFMISVMTGIHNNVIGRDGIYELGQCILETLEVSILIILYFFIVRKDIEDARGIISYFSVIGTLTLYSTHQIWKNVMQNILKSEHYNHHLLIITDRDNAYEAADKIRRYATGKYTVVGMVLTDDDSYVGSTYLDIPVISDKDNIAASIQDKWVDDIFIFTKPENALSEKTMISFSAMGITTHTKVNMEYDRPVEFTIERFADCMVITENIHEANPGGLILKRAMDIAGAIVGLFFTAIITMIVGPIIFFTDPGPIFFAQVRIGMNGRKFKMYKFRSMYKDAEERKKALMAQNQIKGNMFKMDNDPRIIGSGPDGTKHGIGWFIRKTSIDEFPQFLNILKGDMSLVGTRPPTLDEWENYELHHRARMSFRPGLTGLWQVSGRSDIQDFEEVVRLDLEYINNWSIGRDIWIIIKTAAMIFTGSGAK